jgi:hypothetical protein
MSAEMLSHIMRNNQRDTALVANAPDPAIMNQVVTEQPSSSDPVLDIISELLKRRQV